MFDYFSFTAARLAMNVIGGPLRLHRVWSARRCYSIWFYYVLSFWNQISPSEGNGRGLSQTNQQCLHRSCMHSKTHTFYTASINWYFRAFGPANLSVQRNKKTGRRWLSCQGCFYVLRSHRAFLQLFFVCLQQNSFADLHKLWGQSRNY